MRKLYALIALVFLLALYLSPQTFAGFATQPSQPGPTGPTGPSGADGATGPTGAVVNCNAVISPTSLGSSQNNYSPTSWSGADCVRLTASTPVNITGFDGTASQGRKTLMNIGATNAITLVANSASSSAGNKIAS